MPESGLPTLSEALESAESELGLANPSDPLTDSPSVEEEPAAPIEQADDNASAEATPEASEGNPLDDLLTETEEEGSAQLDPSSDEFWTTEVEVQTSAGPERVALSDLRDGYMRQADYTQKTQDIARERELLEEANEFHKAFREDPQGFAAYLAQRAGLIDEDTEVQPRQGVEIWTKDQVRTEAEKLAQEMVQSSPEFEEYRRAQATQRVNHAFTEIEKAHDTKLSDDHRRLVLQRAQEWGVNNLDVVYRALISEAQERAAKRKGLKEASPARPSTPPAEEPSSKTQKVGSVRDAVDLALMELQEGSPV